MPVHFIARASVEEDVKKLERTERIVSVAVHGEGLYAVFTEKRTPVKETRGAA
jgi:hypothetical protein